VPEPAVERAQLEDAVVEAVQALAAHGAWPGIRPTTQEEQVGTT
jgi:hypothetical protein